MHAGSSSLGLAKQMRMRRMVCLCSWQPCITPLLAHQDTCSCCQRSSCQQLLFGSDSFQISLASHSSLSPIFLLQGFLDSFNLRTPSLFFLPFFYRLTNVSLLTCPISLFTSFFPSLDPRRTDLRPQNSLNYLIGYYLGNLA